VGLWRYVRDEKAPHRCIAHRASNSARFSGGEKAAVQGNRAYLGANRLAAPDVRPKVQGLARPTPLPLAVLFWVEQRFPQQLPLQRRHKQQARTVTRYRFHHFPARARKEYLNQPHAPPIPARNPESGRGGQFLSLLVEHSVRRAHAFVVYFSTPFPLHGTNCDTEERTGKSTCQAP